jgi:aminoglycoside phosphotransferase (APT) family kinase protein
VAPAVALCADPEVLGAPFYLMGFVDGVVLDKPKLLQQLEPAAATRSCELLMDTLVELHEVDPAAVGLADFGRPEGFLARQVRRWHQQWQASETRPLDVLGQTVDRLNESLPTQSAPAVVHGDYRLTNVMFGQSFDGIAAVVDWEMATLGDPLADVGLGVVYQDLAQQSDLVMPVMSPDAGFLSARQMVDIYAAGSPRDLSRLSWYVAFGYFKLAVVSEGIHARYLAGKTVGEGFERFGERVPVLLQAALDELGNG